MPRFFIDPSEARLQAGATLALPAGAARHAQVLRLQPGADVTLFDGSGGEWSARIERMGRAAVDVLLLAHHAVDREAPLRVTLALGMPANERMDTLVEKATELGVAAIQPLVCERSVLRVAGERASKKAAHWQAVAVSASEQCGRTRVPRIERVRSLVDWLGSLPVATATRLLLSLDPARPLRAAACADEVMALSGPEGGLTAGEETAARQAGFTPVWLGPRVLRADTAPLALLAHLVASAEMANPDTP